MICLALGYGLKYIWNIINVLQFTIFLLRWRIVLPVLTDKYLRSLKMLVLFEFLPTNEILGAVTEKAGFLGSQKDLLKDMTLIVVGILALIVILLVLLLGKCYCLLDKSKLAKTVYTKLRQKIFYNSIIRYFYTSCLRLQLQAIDILIAGFVL